MVRDGDKKRPYEDNPAVQAIIGASEKVLPADQREYVSYRPVVNQLLYMHTLRV